MQRPDTVSTCGELNSCQRWGMRIIQWQALVVQAFSIFCIVSGVSSCASDAEEAVERQTEYQAEATSVTLHKALAVILQETNRWMQDSDNLFGYLEGGDPIGFATPEVLYELRKQIALGLLHANIIFDGVQWNKNETTGEDFLAVPGPVYVSLDRNSSIFEKSGSLSVVVGMRDVVPGFDDQGQFISAFVAEEPIDNRFSQIEGYWDLRLPNNWTGGKTETFAKEIGQLPDVRTCGNLAADRGFDATDALCYTEAEVREQFCPLDNACDVVSELAKNNQWRILAEHTTEPSGTCEYCLAYVPSVLHSAEPSFAEVNSYRSSQLF
jgi:hypothetical protein